MSPETLPLPAAPVASLAAETMLPPPECVPNYDDFITEDDTPVDNPYSDKQQRLLTQTLFASWKGPGDNRPYVALANVGLYYRDKTPAVVPDMMLSLDVELPEDLSLKRHRSYFLWNYGKPPDLVVEVVSNREGEETGDKLRIYAKCGVPYYLVWDPKNRIQQEALTAFVLNGGAYERLPTPWFPRVGLGVAVWRGKIEDYFADWLRWCDQDGNLMPTADENTEQEKSRAEQEKSRAEQEKSRAEREKARAEREKARAEREKARAEHEKARAEQAESRAEQAESRAEREKARVQRLLAQLQRLGLEPENGESEAK